jgi:methanogenic corrinoid protein MtbC1
MNPAQIEQFKGWLRNLERTAAEECARDVFRKGGSVALSDELLVPALESLGAEWETGEASLAEIYMAGRICEELVDALVLEVRGPESTGIQVAVAPLEDPHLLGKRMVRSVVCAAGYDVADWGRIRSEELVARVLAEKPQALLVSTLMLPSALKVRSVVDALREAGASTPVIVGGAPFRFDPKLGAEVGADASGRNAADAVSLVRELVGGGDP